MSDFDSEIAARTCWMEARGEGAAGIQAVAWVLANRLRSTRWGHSLASVCLAGYQFSCWNTADPNRREMAALADDDPILQDCRTAMASAMFPVIDPTHGSMFYYAIGIPEPSWARGKTPAVQIGRHLFFNDIQ